MYLPRIQLIKQSAQNKMKAVLRGLEQLLNNFQKRIPFCSLPLKLHDLIRALEFSFNLLLESQYQELDPLTHMQLAHFSLTCAVLLGYEFMHQGIVYVHVRTSPNRSSLQKKESAPQYLFLRAQISFQKSLQISSLEVFNTLEEHFQLLVHKAFEYCLNSFQGLLLSLIA